MQQLRFPVCRFRATPEFQSGSNTPVIAADSQTGGAKLAPDYRNQIQAPEKHQEEVYRMLKQTYQGSPVASVGQLRNCFKFAGKHRA